MEFELVHELPKTIKEATDILNLTRYSIEAKLKDKKQITYQGDGFKLIVKKN